MSTPAVPSRCFDPRSRTGSDQVATTPASPRWRFRSTLPHGERRYRRSMWDFAMKRFDPRSRTGSD